MATYISPTTPVDATIDFLQGAGIEYALVAAPSTMSPATEPFTQYPPDQEAKAVVLHDGNVYVIAVIPASRRLDLRKLRRAAGANLQGLRVSTEAQMARDFPLLEVGAVPPFGPMLPAAQVIDVRLLDYSRIVCQVGDHVHSVLIDPLAMMRVTAARAADICQA